MRRAGLILFLGLSTAGCGDDAGGGSGGGNDGTGGAASSSSSTSSSSTSGSSTTSSSSSGETTGSGAGGTDASGGAGGGSAVERELAAVILGELADSPEQTQEDHDALASAGETPAKRAGDFAHDVLLGGPLGDTLPGEGFLGIDRWSAGSRPEAFYGDPGFQEAFGALFAAPPSVAIYERREEWTGWGDLDAADDAEPHWFVLVRGRLASDDIAALEAQHDAFVEASEETVRDLGDVAHVVHLGRDDVREFLAIDVWVEVEPIVDLYSSPEFGEALGGLFEGPPTITVHQSTDWYQW